VNREIGLQSSLGFLDDDFIIEISCCHHRPPLQGYLLEVCISFLSICLVVGRSISPLIGCISSLEHVEAELPESG
jgi:hypothetical protein